MIFPNRNKPNRKLINVSSGNAALDSFSFANLEQDFQSGIFGDKLSYGAFLTAILALVIEVGFIFYSFGKLPPRIPIFFSMPWGDAVLSSSVAIWILPGLNFAFAIFDFLLISRLKNDKFLTRVLSALVILICFVCLYGAIKVISLLI